MRRTRWTIMENPFSARPGPQSLAVQSPDARGPAEGALRQPASDGRENAPLATERAHPGELRDQALDRPVVFRLREQLVRFAGEERARERAQVLDSIVAEPGLHLAQRV